MSTVDVAVPARDLLGESVTWCERTSRVYWVDSRAPTVRWLDVSDGGTGELVMPSLIGSIGLRERGGLVVALQNGFHLLDLETGRLEAIADPEADRPDNRFNDGRVDRQGRFWSGTMSMGSRDPVGALYRLHPDRSWTRVQDGVIVPNSLAWSPDSRVMYFADTYRFRIWAYEFEAATGAMRNERVFADTSGGPGRPDGSTVDESGCLWNAEYGGSRVVRYTPAGTVDRVIAMPVSNPTCCAFGGPGLDTLFVTSARQRLTPEQLAREPLAGSLFAVRPGARGLPEPRFLG